MGSKRIAFQGEPGAYSEEALFLLHPDAEPQPYREFRDVALSVVERRSDFGLLPIENSLVGSIATNFDLIAESGLAIVGEVVSAVHHCLLGLPGATRTALRRVLSHPVALAQCERFLRELEGGRDPAPPAAGVPAKTTLRLKLPHRPGTLARALAAFAAAGLNLTKLESRPDRTTPWEYLFYVDVEARAADGAMAAVLRDLEAQGAVVVVLGSYPRFTPPPS